MKPGYKTTEFWITVATDVGVVAAALQGSIPERYVPIAVAISGAAYAVARGLAKKPV